MSFEPRREALKRFADWTLCVVCALMALIPLAVVALSP